METQIDERNRRVAEIQAEIDELQHEISTLKAEVRAYQDALEHAPEDTSKATKRRKGTRQRQLSETWKRIIGGIFAFYPEDLSLDHISVIAGLLGYDDIKEDSMRSQIASLVNKGYVERVSPGLFKVTQENIRAAGVSKSDLEYVQSKIGIKNEAPDVAASGASTSGGSETPPNESRDSLDDILS
ncbi:hypothetical protein [Aestuariispira ectoiniformans]|uniref:hypothetical protein n=1 Tax=Aestuariispira ectoiniformans TaxID=2775080 RepID=UPI00223B0F35|nr:hypothetical protein [Aestuariispira ectoiniformans]